MSIVMDTSLLVAAMVGAHPAHERSRAWLDGALAHKANLYICAHSLAELYAVLMRLPTKPRIGPDIARRLIRDNIERNRINVVDLNTADYLAVADRMAEGGFSGGSIYDALIVHAACKVQAQRIVTLNETDFNRLRRGNDPAISAP